ncbi:hypothetical protein CHUV2995_00701 [Corynebacterium diphtheriae subsp. lausannense]|nr:hypothetical protein CHUV2995_00701 [Corynebacterium diphtheriae subsp. lausannense]
MEAHHAVGDFGAGAFEVGGRDGQLVVLGELAKQVGWRGCGVGQRVVCLRGDQVFVDECG